MDYYQSRYYDQVAGVFLSADTVQGNTQGMNPYGYVSGNPETLSDPSGHLVSEEGGGAEELYLGGQPETLGGGGSGGDGGLVIEPIAPASSEVTVGNTTYTEDTATNQIDAHVVNADGSENWLTVEPGTTAYEEAQTALQGVPNEGASALAQGEASSPEAVTVQPIEPQSPETTSTPGNQPSTMNPNALRCTQNGISNNGSYIKDGVRIPYTVTGNIEALKNGTLNVNDLPAARVFMKTPEMDDWFPMVKRYSSGTGYLGDPQYLENGEVYTLDNRRLYAFQQAGIQEIPVEWARITDIVKNIWKFDTQNEGISIFLRL